MRRWREQSSHEAAKPHEGAKARVQSRLQKSRKRLKFDESDRKISVRESETRSRYHQRLEAPSKFENPPFFETPANHPVRRAATAGFQIASSGRALRHQVTAYLCRQRGAGSDGGGPVEGNLASAPAHHQINHLVSPARARPNPSVNRSANGRPPWPGPGYAVHFPSPGQGVLPLSPGYLER